jgi:plasmid stabilization system protein ParE
MPEILPHLSKKNMASKPKEIIISPLASEQLADLYEYLFREFGQTALEKFHQKWLDFLNLVAVHPRLFPLLNKRKNLRKYSIHTKTLIVYKPSRQAIEIVVVFHTRQNPGKLKKMIRQL